MPPPTRSVADRLATLVATAFGAGYSPIAPGTAGTLVGLLLYWPLSTLPLAVRVGATLAVSLLGVAAGARVAARVGRKDPGLVVIDEVAGVWVTLLWVPFGPVSAAVGFLAFRLMDVLKPFPARRLEDLPAGWGIMADDLMAGIYASLIVQVASVAWGGA